MSENWIKMRNNLQTHPKVVRMSSALKADRLRVIGGLHAVWCLFDEHSTDGSLSGYTADSVDDLIGFSGFAEALSAVKWLQIRPDCVALPEFEEHNGQSAKRRAMEAKRKREDRAQIVGTQSGQMSASKADVLRTRGDKRREDIDKAKTPSKKSSKKAPHDFEVTAEMQDWAKEKVPGVDLRYETEKFKDWEYKTARSDWPATWRTWMRNAYEKLGSANQPGFADDDWRAV